MVSEYKSPDSLAKVAWKNAVSKMQFIAIYFLEVKLCLNMKYLKIPNINYGNLYKSFLVKVHSGVSNISSKLVLYQGLKLLLLGFFRICISWAGI